MDRSEFITLTSSDNFDITVERGIAEHSLLLKNMLSYLGETKGAIPIPNVNKRILEKVIDWCGHQPSDDCSTEEEKDSRWKENIEFEKEYFNVDQETLLGIILAANYLEIEKLLDLGCNAVANMIKGKSVKEIRRIFNIPNDFTPEEEEEIRRQNEWAEE
ncbi:hypothetical protein N7523_005811 [Penicillium sp. IBT 18751x]|nr:hypothetical protein N7523_005811 [Penicillium sp. IBT 18751x]